MTKREIVDKSDFVWLLYCEHDLWRGCRQIYVSPTVQTWYLSSDVWDCIFCTNNTCRIGICMRWDPVCGWCVRNKLFGELWKNVYLNIFVTQLDYNSNSTHFMATFYKCFFFSFIKYWDQSAVTTIECSTFLISWFWRVRTFVLFTSEHFKCILVRYKYRPPFSAPQLWSW